MYKKKEEMAQIRKKNATIGTFSTKNPSYSVDGDFSLSANAGAFPLEMTYGNKTHSL
jgi:hypothetical protein